MQLRHIALCLGCWLGIALALPLQAQEDEYYTKEVGVALGTNFMLNDVNSTPFAGLKGSGGGALRFVLNARNAIKLELNYHSIGGNSSGVTNFYPAQSDAPTQERLNYQFAGGIVDFSASYELHFLPYGYYRSYLGHRRLVPYLHLGAGMSYTTVGRRATAHFPFGVGVKYKLRPRLNLAFTWSMHLTPSDHLDGLEAPTGIRSEMFRNKDHYATMLFTLTYDFDKKCRTCNKAD